jgi:hypothetical protein
MAKERMVESKFQEINAITETWEQGDCHVDSHEFMFQSNPKHHIASDTNLEEQDNVYFQDVVGICIVSQTCDIVRCCKSRPFVEVAPLVEVDNTLIPSIAKGERPSYAFIPALKDLNLVADLNRVMTIEKSVLKNCKKTKGCTTDSEKRTFAKTLGRKKMRCAFPENFNASVKKLKNRLDEKHGKQTPEGRALRALREIRVTAIPSWAATEIDLHFIFIKLEDGDLFEGQKWSDLTESWLKLVKIEKPYKNVFGETITLENLSAKEYIESDQLDLDHLSS